MSDYPEIEPTRPLELNSGQEVLLHMHSFLNVLNVFCLELSYIHEQLGGHEVLERALKDTEGLVASLHQASHVADCLRLIESFEEEVLSLVKHFFNSDQCSSVKGEVVQAQVNINAMLAVFETRKDELLSRMSQAEAWQPLEVHTMVRNVVNFLSSVEKNAKGRFRIVYDEEVQRPCDYSVWLDVDSVDAPFIVIPPVFQDVWRDLIANARKYTEPGGWLRASVSDDGQRLRLMVEDNGRGIPEDELEAVISYGYRASNALDKSTMGGGFGLSKAYSVTRQFGGRMWIASKLNEGTRVRIELPSRARVAS